VQRRSPTNLTRPWVSCNNVFLSAPYQHAVQQYTDMSGSSAPPNPSGLPQTPRAPSVASSNSRARKIGLTTFPLIHADEPEQGLLPSLLSKVKSTFGATTQATIPAGLFGLGSSAEEPRTNEGTGQTEAQRIAEAVKNQHQRAVTGHARRTSGSLAAPPPLVAPVSSAVPLRIDTTAARASPPPRSGSASSPRKQVGSTLAAPNVSRSGSTSSGGTPSLVSQVSITRKLPADGRLRPRLAAATTSVSAVTSVTHSVAHKTSDHLPVAGPSRIPFPVSRAAHSGLHSALHGHKGVPLIQTAHNNRVRRSSIATLPDSPSSTGLSHMVSGNAELSQNRPYMGGFSLGNDDSRSVRSVALGKKGNKSVSRIIRRLRGEGLSKHYWMADEHCRECYDCKSVSHLSMLG
jgi:1-phosphatidylinositol-3-phosphate 5-kinase